MLRFVLVVVLFIVGCTDQSEPNLSFPQREDSAGVELVFVDLTSVPQTLDLSAAEPVRIGAIDGAPEYLFSGIASVFLPSSSLIGVADRGSHTVRIFDRNGRYVRAFGHVGEGPGEFRSVSRAGIAADSVWVWDNDLRRFTYFDVAGAVLRTVTLAGDLALLSDPRRFADGSFAMSPGISTADFAADIRPGVHRDTSALVRVSAGGVLLDTVTITPAIEYLVDIPSGGRPRVGWSPWNRIRVHAADGDRVHVGTQEEFRIDTWSTDGVLLRSVRDTMVDVELPDSVLSIVRKQGLERIDQFISEPQRAAARTEFLNNYRNSLPSTRAAHGPILVDGRGHLWVAAFSPPDRAANVWYEFGRDGSLLKRIVLPEGSSLVAADDRTIVARWQDELDVEFVLLFTV